ncbi:MAG: DUF4232 domain-containing protein [Actinomycetota bacterium]|nr:DUF4232 domain-containing protein [Actinomycetota bacterium]
MLTLCGAVTACTANHQRMVPWSEVAAARMRPGWPTTAPSCGANDVRLSFRGENGATGTNTLFVAATNISQHACLLSGYPTAVATSPAASQPAPLMGDDWFYLSYMSPGDMAPGDSSMFTIGSTTSCAPYPHRTATGIIQVEFPGGTTTVSVPDLFVGCGLSVTPWYLNKEPPLLAMRATLKLPHHSGPGSTMKYQVVLTNVGRTTIDFRQYCPTYDVSVFPLTGLDDAATAQLNCAAAPAIPPGHEVIFDMQFRLGLSAQHGVHQLGWYTFQSRTRANAQFTIE